MTVSIDSDRYLKFNITVNMLDAAFFGFGIGFASFITIIPLFVRSMTDSAILIGLAPAIHSVGWQLPQIFIANRVSRLPKYQPMVVKMTIHERLPFFGLAMTAWLLPQIGNQNALILTFVMLIWQGLAGGFTATPWQAMLGKIIPSDMRSTFFGIQSSAANLMATLSAVLAGYILTALNSPTDFVYNFLFAGLALMVSYFFLIATREQEHQPTLSSENQNQFAASLLEIIRRDKNFTWFLISRMLSPFAIMGAAFYTVYAVDELGISELQVGYLTAVLLIAQIIANPFLGWLSDKWSHRGALIFGMLAAALGGLLAALATNPNLFFLVFFLTGIANASIWTISMAMTLEFGREDERPSYIGLANSLVAPSTILVPIVGGLMANRVGYPFAFLVSSIVGVLVLIVLRIKVIDPKLLNEEYELETASTG